MINEFYEICMCSKDNCNGLLQKEELVFKFNPNKAYNQNQTRNKTHHLSNAKDFIDSSLGWIEGQCQLKEFNHIKVDYITIIGL